MNFLSNAVKYTDAGSVHLYLGWKPLSDSEILLQISVTDTGIGIKEEDMAKLFDTFARLDLAAHRHIEGAGLGLAITKQICEMMGGRVLVESEWGKGSIFTAELPQRIGNAAPLGQGLSRAGRADIGQSFVAPGGRVLVVDDNAENRKVVKSLLTRTLLRVDTADSGRACLALAEQNHYDVILMDYMMPEMDGVELLGRLRALPDFRTPVIVLTANAVAGVKEMLLDAGFAAYLSKPANWHDLEEAVSGLLPDGMVTRVSAGNRGLDADTRREYECLLLPYGISLTDGLGYLGGDIGQYAKIAEFFVESYPDGCREIEAFAKERDWKALAPHVHSLKSRARAVGAHDLCETAAKLERLCAGENEAHLSAVMPVLLWEWEQAHAGLSALLTRVEHALQEHPAPDTDGCIERLAAALRHNRHYDAMTEIDRLTAAERDPERLGRLREIWRTIDSIDYRKAESLLQAYEEVGTHG